MQLTESSLYNPLALAFVGDAEYGLMVRKMLVSASNRHAGDLHRMAVKYECAPAQAKGAAAIMPLLSEQETAVYKRGRNAHVTHTPKGATVMQYHAATGLEALMEYLSLTNNKSRMEELFAAVVAAIDGAEP